MCLLYCQDVQKWSTKINNIHKRKYCTGRWLVLYYNNNKHEQLTDNRSLFD